MGMQKIYFRQILLLLLSVVVPGSLFAQNDTVRLQEIRVSSVANPVSFRKIPRNILIISQETKDNLPSNSFGELLEQAGGLDIRQRGAFGVQADLNLAGGSFDQALIMINGIPVNDPQTGHHNLDQALSLEEIKRVEIVSGPSSRWFGPNAFSGAINIITKKMPVGMLHVATQWGQHGLFTGSILSGYRTGKMRHEIAVSGSRSDGYRLNTDFKNLTISHQSFLSVGVTRWNLRLGYAAKAFGANGFYTAQFPFQFEKVKVLNAGLGFQADKRKIRYHGSLYWRRLYDRFELFREGKNWFQKQGDWYVKGADSAGFATPAGFIPYQGPNFHRSDDAGMQGSLDFSSRWGKTAAGFAYSYQAIASNVLGEPMSDTLFSRLDPGAFYNRHKSRQEWNVYVNQLYQHKNLSVSAGINLFYNAHYGFIASPGFDLSWFANGNLKLYLSVNRGIRLPTFTDLYYAGPDHISNPNLKPEKGYGFSGGVQYFLKRYTFSASLAYRLGYDIIDWIKKSPHDRWESMNLTRMNTLGAGFSVTFTPASPATGFVRSWGIRYHYLFSGKKSSGYVSLYALDYLRHHFSFYFQHAVISRLSAMWTFSLQKRNGSYFDVALQQAKPYRTVFLLNLKVRYTLSSFVFYVQANNMLNQRYRDIGSVVMPGIWVSGGIGYHLSLKKKKR
jgi:vitamin B12 transporter